MILKVVEVNNSSLQHVANMVLYAIGHEFWLIVCCGLFAGGFAFVWIYCWTRPWHRSMWRDEREKFCGLAVPLAIILWWVITWGALSALMHDVRLEEVLRPQTSSRLRVADSYPLTSLRLKAALEKLPTREMGGLAYSEPEWLGDQRELSPYPYPYAAYKLYLLCNETDLAQVPIWHSSQVKKKDYMEWLAWLEKYSEADHFLMGEFNTYVRDFANERQEPKFELMKTKLIPLMSRLKLAAGLEAHREVLKEDSSYWGLFWTWALIFAAIASWVAYRSINVISVRRRSVRA